MAQWSELTDFVLYPAWVTGDRQHFIVEVSSRDFWLYRSSPMQIQGKYTTLAEAEAAVP
jgi:hypothetical protein